MPAGVDFVAPFFHFFLVVFFWGFFFFFDMVSFSSAGMYPFHHQQLLQILGFNFFNLQNMPHIPS